MKKISLISIILFACLSTTNAQMGLMAVWTGKYEQATSALGNLGNNCEYLVNGKTFWKFFALSQGFCPNVIYVQ
jgi:hypothetical protein